jgi:enolase
MQLTGAEILFMKQKKTMVKIKEIKAREILDSRGNPTIETKVILDDEAIGIASIPSGASLGKYESLELRDGDPSRYNGLGVLRAVANVNNLISPKLAGTEIGSQESIDQILVNLDGTINKSNLGANAILSVSQGVCEAKAASLKINNYEYISQIFGTEPKSLKMPIPTFNIINGGKHGAGNLDFQEFHLIPSGTYSYSDSLRMGEEIYQAVKKVLIHHGAVHSVGDEGGFAPNLFTNSDALEIFILAVKSTNYIIKKDVFLGLDCAANFFFNNNRYTIKDRTSPMGADELTDYYRELNLQYPLMTLEDPFSEDDWDSWTKITALLPDTLIVGDDLLCTNKERLEEAIKRKACRAILVKPNQIGTITETIAVIKTAKAAGWKVIVSHRSGETNDDFIADFAVGVGADFTKFGAPSRGERIVKYNRLLEIEETLKNGQATNVNHS